MSKIKARDLRRMKIEDLEDKLVELRKDLLKINAQISTGTAVENPGRVKQVKKTIARILTIIKEKKTEAKKPKIEEKKVKKEKKSEKKTETEAKKKQ